MTFLRELLAVILGFFISIFIMFFVFAMIASVLGSHFGGDDVVKVKENSILTLKLDAQIKDYAPNIDDPFALILGLNDKRMGLNEMINAIEDAKTDDNIKGITTTIKSFYMSKIT